MSVTVLIPVKNEELHLRQCLAAVVGWADRVVVVDSFSSDGTLEVAASFAGRGVEVVQHEYAGPADQKNWALDHLGLDTDWVLFLDADEVVSPELAREIAAATGSDDNPVAGYFLNRRIIWCGRWIRHGGWFPNWNLRLFRRDRARYEMRRVHEHMVVDGPTDKLDGCLIHEDLRDLTHAIAKHNRYSNDEALEYAEVLEGKSDGYARLFSRDPLARRRWIKTKLWARLPGKGALYFVWCYAVRLGFLDGQIGLRYHLMHAIYKHFDEMKLWELRREREVRRRDAA
ncbi:MAG: glycosyltransferase family 2 protein [Planctomycetota bacterium]